MKCLPRDNSVMNYKLFWNLINQFFKKLQYHQKFDIWRHWFYIKNFTQNIPFSERSTLDQSGGKFSASVIVSRFDDDTLDESARVALQVHYFGLSRDRVHQLVQVGSLQSRYVDALDVTAQSFDVDSLFCQSLMSSFLRQKQNHNFSNFQFNF